MTEGASRQPWWWAPAAEDGLPATGGSSARDAHERDLVVREQQYGVRVERASGERAARRRSSASDAFLASPASKCPPLLKKYR